MKKTGLYQAHLDAGAKMVDFGGWQMPINYGSQIEEHHAVRKDCGMFDVSHMTVIDVHGKDATAFLYRLLAGDITKTHINQALYSTMLNQQGGVIDDLIVYKLSDDNYRIISNAGTRDKDIAWLNKQAADYNVSIQEQADLAIIAIQGPQAEQRLQPLLNTDLSSLQKFYSSQDNAHFIGRTGYTGEDGFELVLPVTEAPTMWQKLLDVGVTPCGLGARDTLRLEAGMHLYGQDMDENISPINCGLAWSVRKKDHDFIGGDIIAEQRQQGSETKLVGLVLNGRGILRHGQVISDDQTDIGIITSGGYSPTTEQAIAFARIPKSNQDKQLSVSIRNKKLPCRVVKLPFVRNGQSLLEE